jgi:hypothetical protein
VRSNQKGLKLRPLLRVIVLLVLLEWAILVFHQTGPQGPDISSYAAYAQSLAFDGDLLFINEYEAWHKTVFITATGYASALQNIGTAFFWTPFLVIAQSGVRVAKFILPQAFANLSPAEAGYDILYFHALNFGNELYGLITLVLCFRLCRRYFSRQASLPALIFTGLASPFFFYMTYFSPNPAMPSAMMAAVFILTWDYTRGKGYWPHWFLLGSLGGISLSLASYNVSFICFPLVTLAASLRSRRSRGLAITNGIALGVGLLLGFSPQLLTWRILFGGLTNPYAGQLDWSHSRMLEVLVSSYHGLYFYAPFLMLASAGILVLGRKDRVLALAMIAAIVVQAYVSGANLAWWAGGSFGMRYLLPLTPIFIFGAAALFEAQPRAWLYAAACMCLIWTYLLFLGIYSGTVDWADFYTLSQQWENVSKTLNDLPHLVASHLLTIKSPDTLLLVLPFTVIFMLVLVGVRWLMTSANLLSKHRVVLALAASPILLVVLLVRADAVGAVHLQEYLARPDYQAYPRGEGDPKDVSYTYSERGRYELRSGNLQAADADFQHADEVYSINSWVPLRLSDLGYAPNRIDWQFANGVTLAAYSVDSSPTEESVARITLYWSVRDEQVRPFEIQLLVEEPRGRNLGQRDFVPTQGQVPVEEWKPRTVYRELYVVKYAAPSASADAVDIQLNIYEPATNLAWPLINQGAAAAHTLAHLKIAR